MIKAKLTNLAMLSVKLSGKTRQKTKPEIKAKTFPKACIRFLNHFRSKKMKMKLMKMVTPNDKLIAHRHLAKSFVINEMFQFNILFAI
jgi:hypothetical protein